MTLTDIIATLKDRDPENPTSVMHVYKVISTYKTSKICQLTEM